MTVKRVFALASVVAAGAFPAWAQTRELNPTVKVLARAQSPVPAECATDPSIVPALEADTRAAEPVAEPAPPSNELRASLRRLQVAAEVNDYAVFKSELAEARRAAAAHPAGGERNAANDALQVFTDIGRVWDYAMSSPTGSFFDAAAQGGALLNAMKRYPDYGRAIADQTITSLAEKYGKTPAQVVIRWHLQLGNVVIPKSVTPSRIAENIDVFDFELADDDITSISELNRDERTGPDPDRFNP